MLKLAQKYYCWNKSDDLDINQYFRTSEFNCQCNYDDCKEQKISVEIIEKLTKLRQHFNKPMFITSGFRCHKHQQDLRNRGVNTVVAKKSTHEEGHAADIKISNISTPDLLKEAEKVFEAIGIANTFLHVDIRTGKKRRWKY